MTINDFIQWVIPLLGVLCLIIGYFLRATIEDVSVLKDGKQDCAVRHAELGRHVSENYATKAEAERIRSEAQNIRVETQHSLDRIHSRLDSLPGEIIRAIRGEK